MFGRGATDISKKIQFCIAFNHKWFVKAILGFSIKNNFGGGATDIFYLLAINYGSTHCFWMETQFFCHIFFVDLLGALAKVMHGVLKQRIFSCRRQGTAGGLRPLPPTRRWSWLMYWTDGVAVGGFYPLNRRHSLRGLGFGQQLKRKWIFGGGAKKYIFFSFSSEHFFNKYIDFLQTIVAFRRKADRFAHHRLTFWRTTHGFIVVRQQKQ